MAKIKEVKGNTAKVVVEAKVATKHNPARIVVKSKGGNFKAIPVVAFTVEETNSLLEIVEKVEKDTKANICLLYTSPSPRDA